MIPPGKTIGILGGGQLGRMLAQAAQSMGYKVNVLDPSESCPAGAVADRHFCAPFEDAAMLEAFARTADVVTYEFENIPAGPLEAVAAVVPLRPSAAVLNVCQNRQREKAWLKAGGFPHAAYAEALEGEVGLAAARVGLPCVVKTADFGYDGKGQMKLATGADMERAGAIFRGRRCVVERWVDFSCELSVIVARSSAGEVRAFPVAENIHRRHILDTTLVPARITPAAAKEAELLAVAVAEKLEAVGLVAVELFLGSDGKVLINEIAPRPHNSGHWSLDGCETSQFEQHVRAICGLPLGPTGVREPTIMVNLLGDAWHPEAAAGPAKNGAPREPDWRAVLAEPGAKLHLYGKDDPRPGRKMGHFNVSAFTLEAALERAGRIKAKLGL